MRGRTFVFATAALLVPAVALADDDTTPCPQDTSTPCPQQQPAPTTTTSDEAATPAPAPAPQAAPPPVIVNQNAAPPPVAEPATNYEQSYEVSDGWNAPLFMVSAVMLGGAYAGSAIVAAGSDKIGDDKLYYPVAGPWLDYSDRSSCNQINPNCSFSSSDKALLIIDGIVQGVGVIGIVGSFLAPTHHKETVRTASIHVAPTATNSSAGLAVFGRF